MTRAGVIHGRLFIVTIIFSIFWIVFGEKETRRIGILESSGNETHKVHSCFQASIDQRNVELVPLQLSTLINVTHKDVTSIVDKVESNRLMAVIGAFNPLIATATTFLNVPYFVTTIVHPQILEGIKLIRLFPDLSTFVWAINDMLDYQDKKRIAIIYNYAEGFMVVEKLIQNYQLEVKAAKVSSDKHGVSEIIDYLKAMRSQFFHQYIVLCDAKTVSRVLRQALLLSMMSYPYNWLVVNMGVEQVDLDDLIAAHPNLTLLQLMVDPNSASCNLSSNDVTLANAILHDAFLLSMHLLEVEDNRTSSSANESSTTLSLVEDTAKDDSYNNGNRSLRVDSDLEGKDNLNHTCEKKVRHRAMDSKMKLERKRRPLTMTKNINVTLQANYKKQVHKDGCTGHLSFVGNQTRKEDFLQLIILGGHNNGSEPPFIQKRNSTDYLIDDPVITQNNVLLEGFCIDILKAMSRLLKFQFTIYLAPDGKFGSKKKHGWTGMVRELIDNKADMALAPFSVTPERSSVVDFTKSFMTKGTTVVVKKPQRTVWMFQFLFPLSNYVWIAIFVSFLVVSLALFGVSRVNADKHRKYTHNFLESFWYIWGTLLRGSLKSSPLAVSSRIISSSWWLFSLIIISVYTANLAAFLTVTNIYLPIENAADLAFQNTYDYGTVNGSQIEDFFKHTNISHYSKMWLHMKLTPGSIVQRVEHGLDRARNSKYAFIWDSPTLRWEIADKCDLMEIGNPFDLKGYGFAVRKDTPYTEALSNAILKLGDTGERQKIEGKWWRVASCPDGRQSTKTTSLHLENVAGLFVVVLGGIALSTIVCSVHQCTSRTRHSSSNNVKEENHYKDEISMTPKRHSNHPPQPTLVEEKDEESVMNRMTWE